MPELAAAKDILKLKKERQQICRRPLHEPRYSTTGGRERRLTYLCLLFAIYLELCGATSLKLSQGFLEP